MALKISQADDIVEVLSTDYFPISQNPAKNEKVRANQIKEYVLTPTTMTVSAAVFPYNTPAAGYTYNCGELTDLTITSIADSPKTTVIYWSSGATPTTLSVPNTIPWVGGSAPTTISANKEYALAFCDGRGLLIEY